MKKFLLFGWACFALALSTAEAGIVTFNIQSSSSNLTLGGSATVEGFGSNPFSQQAAGSLVTQFSGTITVDVDNFSNPTSITFLQANVVALVNGQWLPAMGGSSLNPAADGNYGVSVPLGPGSGLGAWRGLTFDIGSTGAAAIDGSGNFVSNTQRWSHSGGDLDIFSAFLNDGGRSPLASIASEQVTNTGATGSYTSGATATLTLPVAISFNFLIPGTPTVSGTMTYSGSLTATAVPEPSALLLVGSVLGAGFLRRRRS